MKIKSPVKSSRGIPLVSGIVLALCVAGLLVPAYMAAKNSRLLLVYPAEISAPRIDIQKIEEFTENEFLLTYEIPFPERASLSYATYPITMVGTTSAYSSIMGYIMAEGSFFSKQAWTGKLKHAVLNEKAAFAIFGSSSIAGSRLQIGSGFGSPNPRSTNLSSFDTWLVTGVIADGDEDNAKIYVPSSVRGAEAVSLMALVSDTFDEDAIISSLKTLGIREGPFTFHKIGDQCRLLRERPQVVICLFFSLLLLSLLRVLAGAGKNAFVVLKGELKRRYAGEILRGGKTLIRPALLALALILVPLISLLLILRLTAICLPWQDISSLALLNRDLFYPRLAELRSLELVSRLLFGFSLVVLAVFIVSVNFGFEKKTPEGKPSEVHGTAD